MSPGTGTVDTSPTTRSIAIAKSPAVAADMARNAASRRLRSAMGSSPLATSDSRSPGMTLRARSARRRRGNSLRRKEEGTVKVCPEAGRRRRLMLAHLGTPAGGPVHAERRAPAAGSRAFIQDAGRRLAVIPHNRPGHADLAVRGARPADPCCAPVIVEGSAMPERFVGIDVALRDHRVAVLDRDGEAVGKSFTVAA